ncbi:hypothetical protein KSB_93190 [Ktedonobacter robiniae]|uniref:Uncharacterized protein n=1 Tax=Ktedonobacter robiniae TaxID=2778365 RepID=A0ABQ3V768_9CHLR|nr:hypothetical protein KSB_93190 [Ktedonobacter robiniae]
MFFRRSCRILKNDAFLKGCDHMRHWSANVGQICFFDGFLQEMFKKRTEAVVARTTLMIGRDQAYECLRDSLGSDESNAKPYEG